MTRPEELLQNCPYPILTDRDMALIFDGTPDSRYGKVKRLIAQGKLIHVRRGVYCIAKELGPRLAPHPFMLANKILYASIVSLESALSYHGLIPETVFTVTSVSNKRSKEFSTPLGHFSYQHVPNMFFYIQANYVKTLQAVFIIASPWRALCDYVYCYKKNWTSPEPLHESLRIDLDALPKLSKQQVQDLIDYYQSTRINAFLEGTRPVWQYLQKQHKHSEKALTQKQKTASS